MIKFVFLLSQKIFIANQLVLVQSFHKIRRTIGCSSSQSMTQPCGVGDLKELKSGREKRQCGFLTYSPHYHVKAKDERFTAVSSRCRQSLKYENFTSSLGRLRQDIAPKSVPHVQHDYFNQSNHSVALWLLLPSSNFKLPYNMSKRTSIV